MQYINKVFTSRPYGVVYSVSAVWWWPGAAAIPLLMERDASAGLLFHAVIGLGAKCASITTLVGVGDHCAPKLTTASCQSAVELLSVDIPGMGYQ